MQTPPLMARDHGDHILSELRGIACRLDRFEHRMDHMASDLSRITAAVKQIEDLGDALIASYKALAQQIKDNMDNPAELEALAARLDGQATELKDAVVFGTPVDPNTGVPPFAAVSAASTSRAAALAKRAADGPVAPNQTPSQIAESERLMRLGQTMPLTPAQVAENDRLRRSGQLPAQITEAERLRRAGNETPTQEHARLESERLAAEQTKRENASRGGRQ